MGSAKVRVAVFNTHPIQYYAPIWRKLAKSPALDVQVLYGSDFSIRGCRDREFGVDVAWDVPLLEGYASEFLEGFDQINQADFWNPRSGPAVRAVFSSRPQVLVVTAYHAAFWYGILAAATAVGCRVVIRHDATDEAFASRGFKKLARSMILRTVYRAVSRFAVVGARARRHLKAHGVTERRMTWSPFCVDTNWVEDQRRRWLSLRSEIRRASGIGENSIAFLFCGKLIEQKDPLLFFDALRHLPEAIVKSLHLILAGSGPLQRQFKSMARAVLGERFHDLGFLNQSELGKAYTMSDALLLPSRSETWGLVVNEAMQFGLPALLADGVGCYEDLVPDDSTGRVFPAGNSEAMSVAMQSLVEDLSTKKVAIAAACRSRAARYSLDAAATGLHEAILAARG
jgi:glycosyltransferase involved in cell wall biosynthesis